MFCGEQSWMVRCLANVGVLKLSIELLKKIKPKDLINTINVNILFFFPKYKKKKRHMFGTMSAFWKTVL